MSLVNVYNEWDPLEEVIVGTAKNAFFPQNDLGFNTLSGQFAIDIQHQNVTKKIITETEEDITQFISELKKCGVVVKRPTPLKEKITTHFWQCEPYFCYCPRDILLAIGDTIIETPSVFRSRINESNNYKEILLAYFKSGARWLSAPKPRLQESSYNLNDHTALALNNLEPVFDAANVLRAGKDIFYQVSDSGNWLGFKWLQSTLGHDFCVHALDHVYSSMHIDSTLCLLRPGLLLANPSRVNQHNLPPLLKKWDIIYAPEMIEYRYSALPFMASKWLGMNLLMLSPSLAAVDKHQLPLIKLLEKNNIEVMPVLLRHGHVLGGGLHCITLDVRRKGNCEHYF